MPGEAVILMTIAGMALVTYLTRVSGLYLMNFVTPTPRVEAWLRHIPGAILVAIVAPAVFATSLAQALAALATLLAAMYSKNILVAMIVGIVAVWLLRMLL